MNWCQLNVSRALYGLECRQLNKADLQSLNFISNRLFLFIKLFRTGSKDAVQECRRYFRIELPSCLIKKKQDKFWHGITAWRICFVDIVVSCELIVLLYSESIFSIAQFHLSTTVDDE